MDKTDNGIPINVTVQDGGTVIIGNNTNVTQNHPEVNSPQHHMCTSQTLQNNNEASVLDKCSKFVRQDCQNMYGTINEYPWQMQKKPLKSVFTAINLKSVEYGCEHQDGDIMYKIFDRMEGCEKPTRVLLYGSPGIGKTTLCQKYVIDWANEDAATQAPFNEFKVVIFLKLHDAKGTLEEIMEEQVFCTRLSTEEKGQFFSSMKEHPEWFLFILDGMNECKVDELPDIKNILENKTHRGVYLITTSRPELRRSWKDLYHCFHAHFCIKGYSDKSVKEFVEKHLKDDQSKAEKLTKHIQETPKLMDLARIPLLTPIICEHWKESKQLPTVPTMTKLINYCVTVVIKSYCHKKNVEFTMISNLPSPIQQQLENLEKLALHGVMKHSMNYTNQELKDFDIDPSLDLGFLSAQPDTCGLLKEGVHCFAHKSIQEFVAAKQLVKHLSSKKVSSLLTDESITKFHSVLVFMAGLLSNKQNCHDLLNFIKQLSTSSTIYGCFLEKAYYGCRMQLVLESCNEAWKEESDGDGQSIATVIPSLIKSKELFRKVITRGLMSVMSYGEAQGLSVIVKRLQLTSLNLSSIWIQRREVEILATQCLKGNHFLKCVKFGNCCLCPDGVEAICASLESMRNLEEVNLTCSNLSDKGLKAVAKLLRCSTNAITILHLDDHLDTKHIEQEKQRSLERNVSLQDVIVELSAFSDQRQKLSPGDGSIMDLIDAFNGECELEEISLHHRLIGNQMERWLSAFHKKYSIRKVRLQIKHLSRNLRQNLIDLVQKKPNLEKISITLKDDNLDTSEFKEHFNDFKDNTDDRIELTHHCNNQSVRSLQACMF